MAYTHSRGKLLRMNSIIREKMISIPMFSGFDGDNSRATEGRLRMWRTGCPNFHVGLFLGRREDDSIFNLRIHRPDIRCYLRCRRENDLCAPMFAQ